MTGKTIVITRALGDEAELAEALHALDFRVIHEPLSQIFLLHTARAELEGALAEEPEAIVLTSKHGVAALAALTPLRDLPMVCVGEATAEAAETAGFDRVYSAGGSVERLSDYLISAYDPGSHFVYASAEHTRTDLAALLAVHDMQVERIVVYEAEAATQFSDTLAEQLRRGQLDAVTFFSQRTAATFAKLLAEAELENTLETMEAFCLSETVAGPVSALPWRKVHIADQPTLASLVASVDNEPHG